MPSLTIADLQSRTSPMAKKWKKGAMKAAADDPKKEDEKPAPKKKGSPLHDNPRSPKE